MKIHTQRSQSTGPTSNQPALQTRRTSYAPILQMQKTMGNRAVMKYLQTAQMVKAQDPNTYSDITINTLDELNNYLTQIGLNTYDRVNDLQNASVDAADKLVKNLKGFLHPDITNQEVNRMITNELAIVAQPPKGATLQTFDGRTAWVITGNKPTTDIALRDLVYIANGDDSKIHRSKKMRGEEVDTPYVHDETRNNYVCTYDLRGRHGWDGHPIIQIRKTGKVNAGIHVFS
jgi:hypothetical protein